MSRRRPKSSLGTAFIAHRIEMRESPAWAALEDEGRRILDRLEVEHMRNGGAENGKLCVTYAELHLAGVRRSSIAEALRQCAALGFIVINRFGYRTARTFKPPSRYRLTYLNGCGSSPPPTDDWQRVKTRAEADQLVEAARLAPPDTKIRKKSEPKVKAPDTSEPSARYGAMGARSAPGSDGSRAREVSKMIEDVVSSCLHP